MNKKSSNITELRGNFTVGVTIDDSLIVSEYKKIMIYGFVIQFFFIVIYYTILKEIILTL